jgi:hypothetical protein
VNLGTLRIEASDGQATARLTSDDPSWVCDDADLGMALNALFPIRNYSPADGRFGAKQFNAATVWMKDKGWKVVGEVPPAEPIPPGAVM